MHDVRLEVVTHVESGVGEEMSSGRWNHEAICAASSPNKSGGKGHYRGRGSLKRIEYSG